MGEGSPEIISYVPGATDGVSFSPEEIETLERINRRIASGETLASVIDFLFDETRRIMPCDRIGIGFIEESGSRLSLYYVRAAYEPLYLDHGYAADIRGSSLAPIFESGRPRLINDLARYFAEHPDSESTRLLLKEGVRSSMTCPLEVDGRRVGLLFRSSREPNAYGKREAALHMAVAERLSQAAEKAYRIEELSAAMSAYMEMLGFVTHELKSPLSSIIQLGRSLADGYFGAMEPKHREMLERILRKAEYLISLSNEYLNLSRFESGSARVDRKRGDIIADALEPALEIVAPQIQANAVTLERNYETTPLFAEFDTELIKIVAVNLIGNAVKYGNVKGRVRINAATTANAVRVSVWNEGPGFLESDKKNLFKKFSRLQTPELRGRKGSGIGLYLSWKAIQAHGGKIRAESEHGRWAEFIFEIPIVGEPSA
ncbi:MAG TPA: GAF domain-containing sensor histidine kinase [Spirochaetota bacterium]|nr:GAF domain-containing sensor histidine kinase [Spirochaetota bacterium]